jgi:competence protein ComEA
VNRKTIWIASTLFALAALGVATLFLTGESTTELNRDAVLPESGPPPEMVPESASVPLESTPSALVSAENDASGKTAPLMVESQGAVSAPGVYSFPSGARVFDAMAKAGGTLKGAEIRDINIAAVLVDGSVLSIPFRQVGRNRQAVAADLNPPIYTRSGWTEKAGPATLSTGGVATPATPSKINLNTATQAELEALPGVGEKTAEKIMRFRETQPFTQVDDLRYIQGIGDKRMETLRPHVMVE